MFFRGTGSGHHSGGRMSTSSLISPYKCACFVSVTAFTTLSPFAAASANNSLAGQTCPCYLENRRTYTRLLEAELGHLLVTSCA